MMTTENTDTGSKDNATSAPIDTERRKVVVWLWRIPVLAFAAGAVWAVLRAYRTLFLKGSASLAPRFQAVDPIPIISERLVKEQWDSGVWQALEFSVADTPAILIHSPEALTGSIDVAGKHLVAFSRICTHLGCPVTLNRNIDTIAAAYNYRPKDPSLVCPCHYSVFSVLENGHVKSGPARQPLPRVRLENRAGIITATGIEVYDA